MDVVGRRLLCSVDFFTLFYNSAVIREAQDMITVPFHKRTASGRIEDALGFSK